MERGAAAIEPMKDTIMLLLSGQAGRGKLTVAVPAAACRRRLELRV